MKVYSPSEVAKAEGMTRHGLLWWIKQHGVECCETGNGRKFFTQEQLEQFKQRRASSKSTRHKNK